MSTVVKNRYSDKDLQEFRDLIEEKIEKANEDLALLKSSYMNNGNNGTFVLFLLGLALFAIVLGLS